jgi:ribonuclease BN (tRNA processing enzyme)
MAGAARLTVLGSGTAVPLADRATSCCLLDDGAGTRLLLDLGPGALQRAAQAGCPLPELSGVLLTHAHPDHCADLAALQFALRSPALPARRRPLPVVGHPGVLLVAWRLRNAWPGWLAPGPEALELRAAAPGPLAPLGGLQLRAFRVVHHETSLGYRITLPDGFTLAYPGDVTEGGDLLDLSRDADLLVLEAAGSERAPIPGHLTPRRAGAVAAACGARHVLLTHFYPAVLAEPVERQARETFEGRLTLAQDGLILPLGR